MSKAKVQKGPSSIVIGPKKAGKSALISRLNGKNISREYESTDRFKTTRLQGDYEHVITEIPADTVDFLGHNLAILKDRQLMTIVLSTDLTYESQLNYINDLSFPEKDKLPYVLVINTPGASSKNASGWDQQKISDITIALARKELTSVVKPIVLDLKKHNIEQVKSAYELVFLSRNNRLSYSQGHSHHSPSLKASFSRFWLRCMPCLQANNEYQRMDDAPEYN